MSLTHTEILHQPDAWRKVLEEVPRVWRTIAQSLDVDAVSHILLVGSGTSLYLAQTASQNFMEITGKPAVAAPASQVFLSPATTVPGSGPVLAFVISRSGATSEALLAADFLRSAHPLVRTIGITCNPRADLKARCDFCIELPFAAEDSVVMTKSVHDHAAGSSSHRITHCEIPRDACRVGPTAPGVRRSISGRRPTCASHRLIAKVQTRRSTLVSDLTRGWRKKGHLN